MENKILKTTILIGLLVLQNNALAQTVKAPIDDKINAKISATGLNRISNPPYQIIQVTGDDTKYSLKSDDDGANIYLMPIVKRGEHIELILKNNIGQSHDLVLEVAHIKGQSLVIDSKSSNSTTAPNDLVPMFTAMKENLAGKYYVKNLKKELAPLGQLQVMQTQLYKWKDISGGVFEIANKTKTFLPLDIELLQKRFINVEAYWTEQSYLNPREKTRVFIIQRNIEQR